MGTATQVTDFSDLYTDLQNRVREQTGVTATENQAKRYINIGLHDLHIGRAEICPWCERSAVLITQPQYTTGTVSATKGSTTITGSSTLWNTANEFGANNMRVGGKITFAGYLDVYEISAVASDTSATLTGKFVTADVTDVSYVYFEDEYALASDFLRPIDQQRFSDSIPIEIMNRNDFRRQFPTNGIPGRPKVATIIDKPFNASTTPVRKIRFHNPPDIAYNIPYAYATSNLAVTSAGVEQANLVNDTDEPIVPLRYRHIIVLNGLFHWYRDKKNDQRSIETLSEYNAALDRMGSDTEIGATHAAIRVRRDAYVRRARRPWSKGGARYDLNGRFDRMEI